VAYTRDRLGSLLLRAGVISEDQLFSALERQRVAGGKLGQVLVRDLVVDEETLARFLAEQKDLEYVSLASYAIDREAAALIPERLARRALVVPIGYRDGSLVLAMADPLDVEAIDDVRLRTGRIVMPVVSTPTQVLYAIDKFITGADAYEQILPAYEEAVEEVEVAGEEVPIVRLVNQLLREAVLDGASDVHIEPEPDGTRVRFRVDGVLHEVMRVPPGARAGLLSRVKVMAELDIAERRRPQDGRIRIAVNDRSVDLRVATLPTPHGENIVIRVLGHDTHLLTLHDLGMDEPHRAILEGFLSRPYGEVLISGPTGSGKSTTLYSCLQRLNDVSRKIITIEDPIEYQIAGITQMAVNPHIRMGFAQLLRTVLRSDPDVVMVGEIRDAETAQIATRAALTGHLVLSSIHTNDAPSALTRLADMEVAPFVASSALVGVVAQRLARRLCPACRELTDVTEAYVTERGFTFEEIGSGPLYVPSVGGCDECHNRGYRGRIGIFEVMEMDAELTRLYLAQASTDLLRAAALASGMKTLRRDALEKVFAGLTSLDEVARVVV